jgi:hypothetical protein
MARFCEKCGGGLSTSAGFCGSCGAKLGSSSSMSSSYGAATPAREERVMFGEGGVTVTSARFIAGGQTYAMSGITSVKQGVTHPPKLWPVLMILLGVLMMVAVINDTEKNSPVALGVGVSIFLLVVGFLWLRSKRPIHAVVLTSASSETKAYTSRDEAFVDRVVRAINDAIVHRG